MRFDLLILWAALNQPGILAPYLRDYVVGPTGNVKVGTPGS